MISYVATPPDRAETPFLGLAPFLRANIAGTDIRPRGWELLERVAKNPADAESWMNLSTIMQCLGERELGLSYQDQALRHKRIYRLAAAQQPARLGLLVLSAEGDISVNTPLDCLLEDSDVDLIFYYLSPHDPLGQPVPEHDALFVAVSELDENRSALAALEHALADWPKPVINAPQFIPRTGRAAASRLLHDAPGILIPPTLVAPRAALLDIAAGHLPLSGHFAGVDFPIIVRPVGSHAGHDLARIERRDELAAYLDTVAAAEFFLAPFIDYRGPDGLFRKYRVALVDGEPYACHMGVSAHWMIHYVNAGMYDDAKKRDEEAAFMENFADFAARHRAALHAICRRTELDYLCVDCAETRDGRLLIFEIDHTMVVHAMDPAALFPYKQAPMQKVKTAMRNLLLRRTKL